MADSPAPKLKALSNTYNARKFEKVVKIIYIVMEENHTVYNGSFRNCIKKNLLDILPGGLYRYIHTLILCFIAFLLYSIQRH